MCIPITSGRGMCYHKFKEKDNECMICPKYSNCKRNHFEILASKVKPVKLKGKCPKGKRIWLK